MRSITISGLGGKGFEQGLQNLFLWDTRLARQFEEKLWKPWSAKELKGNICIELSNRMLTPSYLCTNADELVVPDTFGKAVRSLVDDRSHKYLEDNQVMLFEHIKASSIDK